MANVKKKVKKTVLEGNVYIQATFNNTIITVTDLAGNAISWASAGGLGFDKKSKFHPIRWNIDIDWQEKHSIQKEGKLFISRANRELK